ncbi:MAG: hypothetical protein LBV04_07910 [Deferribacteraceae bacterium]|jgi:hypothetical protein|nr:hypothetical protein [Deferribacteraceae bacterium]
MKKLFVLCVSMLFMACSDGSDGGGRQIDVSGDFAPFNVSGCSFKSADEINKTIAPRFGMVFTPEKMDVDAYLLAECVGNVEAQLDNYGDSLPSRFYGPTTEYNDGFLDTYWESYDADNDRGLGWLYTKFSGDFYVAIWIEFSPYNTYANTSYSKQIFKEYK